MTTPTQLDAEVVVVGARCAGATTAMLLAQHGHDVLVVDRAAFPSDTLSTHAIARSGVVQLNRWGLLEEVIASGAPPIRKVVFHAGGQSTERTLKDVGGVDLQVAPRRHILDTLLLGAAERSGARVLTGVTVDGVRLDDSGRAAGVWGRSDGGDLVIDARFVVGADGLRSRVARSVGAPMIDERAASGAAHYAYYAGDFPAIEYFYADNVFAGIFPTHGGEACVWVCEPTERALAHRRRGASLEATFDTMVRHAPPAFADRLQGSRRTSQVHGMSRMPNHIRQAFGPGWALVGDAGYHRDAITGYGISDAFRDAELLADALDRALRVPAVETDALASYQRERDDHIREIFEITCQLSQFPSADRFVGIQKEFSRVIESESKWLASRPARPGASLAA